MWRNRWNQSGTHMHAHTNARTHASKHDWDRAHYYAASVLDLTAIPIKKVCVHAHTHTLSTVCTNSHHHY